MTSFVGARVDSDAPLYQMFDKSLWSGFDFQERYPGRSELRRYFDFIDSKLHFSDSTTYNADAKGAVWSESDRKWEVEVVVDGRAQKARSTWFIPAIGFAAKAYIPKIEGMDRFKGVMHHSAVSESFRPYMRSKQAGAYQGQRSRFPLYQSHPDLSEIGSKVRRISLGLTRPRLCFLNLAIDADCTRPGSIGPRKGST